MTEKIEKSEDYEIFKFTKLNRAIDQIKVRKFAVASLKSPHLMETCPILVNKSMEIIDGQHRFLACKINKLPIFYIKSESISYEDIITLNSDQKNWGINDYIKHHCEKGNENFIKLVEFSNVTSLSISISCTFLGFNRKTLISSIKTGTLLLPDKKFQEIAMEKALQFKSFENRILENYKKDILIRNAFSYTFLESLAHLDQDIDIHYFFKKLEENFTKIVHVRSWMEYHRQFRTIGALM